jgi:hypothetical protein
LPSQEPCPLQAVVLFEGDALLGPEMLAWQVVEGVLVSHSLPSYPASQTQLLPSQCPCPLQTVVVLNNHIKRLAGDALFGPEMFAPEQDPEVGAGVCCTGGEVGSAVVGAAVVGAGVGAAVLGA